MRSESLDLRASLKQMTVCLKMWIAVAGCVLAFILKMKKWAAVRIRHSRLRSSVSDSASFFAPFGLP